MTELGDFHRECARRTRRLVPGVWVLALALLLLVVVTAALASTNRSTGREDVLGPGWVTRALALQYELAADVPLRNAPWVGTHNSFNSVAEMGPTLSTLDSNQLIPLTDQLDQGVRSLELDLHWFPSPQGGGFAPVVCHALEGGGGCTVEKPLDVVLAEISAWLRERENARQVLLLYLEDDLAAGQEGYDEAAAELETAFGDLIYRPAPGGACAKLPLSLTRKQMLRSGARVLIVSNCGQGSAWNEAVFDWSKREEERPFGYTDYPDCGDDFPRKTYDRSLVRYYEDSTYLTQGTGGADDGIDGQTAGWMARCGVDLIGLDQLDYADPRLSALVWSWAPGQPARGSCALQRVDTVQAFGRWHTRRCSAERRPACLRPGGRWAIADEEVRVASAAGVCRSVNARFAVPRTGPEAQRLRKAMARARVDEVWLAYRRVGGKWTALNRRGGR